MIKLVPYWKLVPFGLDETFVWASLFRCPNCPCRLILAFSSTPKQNSAHVCRACIHFVTKPCWNFSSKYLTVLSVCLFRVSSSMNGVMRLGDTVLTTWCCEAWHEIWELLVPHHTSKSLETMPHLTQCGEESCIRLHRYTAVTDSVDCYTAYAQSYRSIFSVP